MNTYNNFELLLLAASEEYCYQQTQLFLNTDTTDFPITDNHRKQFQRILRKNENKHLTPWKAIKIAAVACLLCLSIAFTACVCIPKIRNAIKEVILEWYDQYVAIGFEAPDPEENINSPEISDQASKKDDTSVDQPSNNTETIPSKPPIKILRKAYATYLPEDYTIKIDIDNDVYYSISYYKESECIVSLTQNIISEDLHWADSEFQIVHYTTVNNFQAILLEEIEISNYYSIIWQDEEYEYYLEGIFSSMDEIIKIAEGIKLQ